MDDAVARDWDYVIVGSGAGGGTLAARLAEAGMRVFLIEAGLPTANLIDFVYGPDNRYWHTPEDTPENVSATTLGMVGEVVAELIYSGG